MISFLKTPNPLNVTENPTFVKFKTDYPTATAPKGLKGFVQVEKLDGTVLDLHQCSYNPDSRDVSVNIQSAFSDLAPPLPPDAALQKISQPFFVLEDSFAMFRLKAFDRYNSTPFEDAAVNSNYYNIIYGDTPIEFDNNPHFGTSMHVCHSYPSGYRKTVTPKQPDFLNIILPFSLGLHTVEVTVFLSNRWRVVLPIYSSVEIPDNTLVSFPCGFEQLDIQNRIIALYPTLSHTVFITGYHYAVYCEGPEVVQLGQPKPPRYTILSKSYELDARIPDATIYLAIENGLGGIETQYFPIAQRKREIEKTTSELMLFADADKRQGKKVESGINFWNKYTVKSRVLPRVDIEHLQRIIHAPLWEITPNSHFERVYADSKTMDAPPIHAQSGQFIFSYTKF